jgi:type IV pilus assembly protein PilY1
VWKSVLVGGLGRGGRGYYALDITDPATPKALWEFTNANMGYSYGNPLITKVCDDASCATKTWAVLVTSGYNNIPNDDGAAGDGVGRLYVLNAATGALIRTLSTGVGNVANPSGLARISGYVVNPQSDNTVEAVYGGDLNGNLWRFDVDATLGAAGYEAQLLAILKDAGNNLQSISTAPELGEIPSNHVKVVYVGTGRFLAGEDASDTSQQSIYAIKDDRAAGATPATPIFDNPGGDRTGVLSAEGFVRQVHSIGPCPAGSPAYICIAGQNVLLTTAKPVDFTLNNGWFVDLINASERANTDPALVPGLLVFNTNAPSLLACDVGGKGYQYWFDYKSGGPLSSTGIIGLKLGDKLYSAPTIISTGGGELKVLSGCSGVDCYDVRQPPGAGEILAPRRTAWREWIRE